jgi:hypothetical protein
MNTEPTVCDVRDAAKRYLGDGVNYNGTIYSRSQDRGTLARFALSLLDPTPVDAKWAAENLGNWECRATAISTEYLWSELRVKFFHTGNQPCAVLCGSRCLAVGPTIGQLRSLLHALTTEPRQ